MGGLLSLPAATLSVSRSIAEEGIVYWVKFIPCFIYLWISKKIHGKRFDLYDYSVDFEPEKNGFFVPEIEWDLDSPKEQKADFEKNSDDVFFFGANSQSDTLVLHVSRQTADLVRSSLILKLSDGREYILPKEHSIQRSTQEGLTFGSSRFKLQCILPMRKWRIFFNGMLEKRNSSDSSNTHCHVKFSLIFTTSSGIFDFTTDMSNKQLARSMVSSSCGNLIRIQHLRKHILDSYEQSGMFLGTLKIEDEDEMEFYLWGNRGRYRGATRNLTDGNFLQLYGTFQDGALIRLGMLDLPGIISKMCYGYVMRPNGFMYPINDLVEVADSRMPEGEMLFTFSASEDDYKVVLKKTQLEPVECNKEFHGTSYLYSADMKLNDKVGKGILLHGSIEKFVEPKLTNLLPLSTKKYDDSKAPLVVDFEDEHCRHCDLTGGKGSSLGSLFKISQVTSTFEVPKGIVLTTAAYNLFISSLQEELINFQKAVWSTAEGKSQDLCHKIVMMVRNKELPPRICQAIEDNLKKLFPKGLDDRSFAVRSSAIGEDTERMSAAGQLETFLGLRNLQQIIDAVRKCWASQFTFLAIEYKRRYGQLLNSPMAVVIQEMVPCEAAGVAFTCDPLSGDPSYISISANWGLGESVVSASAESDRIILRRDAHRFISLHKIILGKKEKKIVQDGQMGTKEVEVSNEQSSRCCLSEEKAIKLAEVFVQIEEQFGSPRDLEWGILDSKLFLFQSRPITSLDTETAFESKHTFDTYLRREDEFFSKYNVGEVMPGATSPLGLDVLNKMFGLAHHRKTFVLWGSAALPSPPYFSKRFVSAFNHVFFCTVDAFWGFREDASDMMKAMITLMFKNVETYKKCYYMTAERHTKRLSYLLIPFYVCYTVTSLFVSGMINRFYAKQLKSFKIPIESNHSATEIFDLIGQYYQFSAMYVNSHTDCSMSSAIWNSGTLYLLSKARGVWSQDVYSDFAKLLSSSTQVESADVPAAIEKLSSVITSYIKPEEFKAMSVEQALEWLETSSSEAGVLFRKFLEKHGHRCLKEFDVYSTPWGNNPKTLVKTLQDSACANGRQIAPQETPTFSDSLSSLRYPLKFSHRLLLKLLLPYCRQGIRNREFSKSVLIKCIHKLRKCYLRLGESMVSEGYLPNKELLFFLQTGEISRLLKTRSPEIVSRTQMRWRCHNELDKLTFPVLCCGIPKPENSTNEYDGDAELVMEGLPISSGIVKATARVVMNLSEAGNLKPGDILITYSTDIGWTPYFPMLSGVVTVLGDLLSHGAVIAREYGIPCVIGLHGATQAFKSGDTVVLDGSKGTLKRIRRSSDLLLSQPD